MPKTYTMMVKKKFLKRKKNTKKEWKFVKHKRKERVKQKKKSNPEHTRIYGCFLFSFSLFSKLGSFEV